jgi:hypothetical protein
MIADAPDKSPPPMLTRLLANLGDGMGPISICAEDCDRRLLFAIYNELVQVNFYLREQYEMQLSRLQR